jgi:hypothetical protein
VARLEDPFFQKSQPHCVLGRVFKRSSGVPIEFAAAAAKGEGEWCVELTTGFRRLFGSKHNRSAGCLPSFTSFWSQVCVPGPGEKERFKSY